MRYENFGTFGLFSPAAVKKSHLWSYNIYMQTETVVQEEFL